MKNLMKLSVVLVAAALAFSSCNCFKKMAKNRDDINLTVTPEILTLNNGIVAADINVTFPVKYFNAKAVIKVTPVIVFEGGEVAGAAKYLQGSKVDENYTVVDKKNGGSYTQHVEFPYDPRMDKCALQLRAEIKCPGGKCKEFTLVNLNTGAIPTKEQAAVLAGNDEAAKAALAKEFGWGFMASTADTFTTSYTAAGGISTVVHLPDEGITGNDHFMFQDMNNDVIAEHIENWIQANVMSAE